MCDCVVQAPLQTESTITLTDLWKLLICGLVISLSFFTSKTLYIHNILKFHLISSRMNMKEENRELNSKIKLLRIPLNQLSDVQASNITNSSEKPEKKTYQLLKVDVNKVNSVVLETPKVKLFHLPCQKENTFRANHQRNENKQKAPQQQPPRLLDLRVVLNLKSQRSSVKESALPQKTPQLIRLPHIYDPPLETKLLESPKREKPQPTKQQSRRRRERDRKVLDVRKNPEITIKNNKEQQTTPRFVLI